MESIIKLSYDKTVTGTETANNYVGVSDNAARAVLESDTGKIVYVNYTTGNDSTGDGSSGNPYKTLTKGYTDIDGITKTTVEVMDSAYYAEDITEPTQAAVGQTPTFDNSTEAFSITGNLLGFYIIGASQTIQAKLYNCDILGCGSFSVNISFSEMVRCLIYDCTDLPAFVPGAAGSLLIQDCGIWNNVNQTLSIDGSGTGIIIEYLAFYGNSKLAFTNNGGDEIIRYSIFSGNTNAYIITADTTVNITDCLVNSYGGLNSLGPDSTQGTGTILSDPLFVSTVSPFDFNLQSIAGGYAMDSPAIDMGDSRDIGCYDVTHSVSSAYTDISIDAPFNIEAPVELLDLIERTKKDGSFKATWSLIQLEIALIWEAMDLTDSKVLRQIQMTGGEILFYPFPSAEPSYYLTCQMKGSRRSAFSIPVAQGSEFMQPMLSLIVPITRAMVNARTGGALF